MFLGLTFLWAIFSEGALGEFRVGISIPSNGALAFRCHVYQTDVLSEQRFFCPGKMEMWCCPLEANGSVDCETFADRPICCSDSDISSCANDQNILSELESERQREDEKERLARVAEDEKKAELQDSRAPPKSSECTDSGCWARYYVDRIWSNPK